ncbi:MAG TPA: nucleotidyltransferase family protein [Ilumatobacteraceae bacterium]|nr:nucleotidyltransferase family protein [Ilumatobacteraceae bacterium]
MSSVDILIVGGHEIDRARLADICEQFGVVELALFGSVGRGEESSASDVDLLYVAAEGAQLGFALNRLEDELAELFGRHVDLVSRKSLHRLLRDRVEREATTLYAA